MNAVSTGEVNEGETHTFAEASFSETVGLLLKGHKTVHIHRRVSHGLEVFVGDE